MKLLPKLHTTHLCRIRRFQANIPSSGLWWYYSMLIRICSSTEVEVADVGACILDSCSMEEMWLWNRYSPVIDMKWMWLMFLTMVGHEFPSTCHMGSWHGRWAPPTGGCQGGMAQCCSIFHALSKLSSTYPKRFLFQLLCRIMFHLFNHIIDDNFW